MTRRHTPGAVTLAAGSTLVEVLLTVVLVAVCLAPAMSSMWAGVSAQRGVGEASRETGCLQYAMEHALAEPYVNLLAVAYSKSPAPGSFTSPTTYSFSVGADCPSPVNVYILRYSPSLSNPFASTNDDMLYLRAAIPNGASLGTLAIRR